MHAQAAIELPSAKLVRSTQWHVRLWAVLSTTAGVALVVAFMAFLFPVTMPNEVQVGLLQRELPILGVYLLASLIAGSLIMERRYHQATQWAIEGRAAGDDERAMVLGYAKRWAVTSFSFWIVGSALHVVVASDYPRVLLIGGMETILLGGLTTCAVQYLVLERKLRPLAARALAGGPPPRRRMIGVRARLTFTWLLATGIPLFGITAFTANDVIGDKFASERVVAASLALATIGLLVGFTAMLFAARAVADPLVSMRDALARVERGDLDTRVPVDDASEVGLLEAGFNRMTAGLAERERLRQAFGTFVDPALAERVLAEGIDLAGEDVEVSLLFLDVQGFTAFAEQSEARTVVAMLNDLFGAVVPVVLRHGGHANKFIGDGLLAVFGTPQRHLDHADRAVAAAVEIAALVRQRYQGDVRVGIGVNTGKVVVGTIGGGGRLDFTVIGDPVNTAARVEAATRETGDDVLITDETRSQLADGRDGWIERPSVPLRGKQAPVRLFAPG